MVFLKNLLKTSFFLLFGLFFYNFKKGVCGDLLEKHSLSENIKVPFFQSLKNWKKGDSFDSLKKDFEAFKEEKRNVDQKDKAGKTLLFYAAGSGNPFAVNLLLQEGASVDSLNGFYEKTPLMKAVSKGRNSQVIRDLLKCGASREKADKKGFLPVHYALKNKNFYFSSLVYPPLESEGFKELLNPTEKDFLLDKRVKTYLCVKSLEKEKQLSSLTYLVWDFLKDAQEVREDPLFLRIQRLMRKGSENLICAAKIKRLFQSPQTLKIFLEKIQRSENFIVSENAMKKIMPYYSKRKKLSAVEAQVLLSGGSLEKVQTYRDKLSFLENVIFFLALAQISE